MTRLEQLERQVQYLAGLMLATLGAEGAINRQDIIELRVIAGIDEPEGGVVAPPADAGPPLPEGPVEPWEQPSAVADDDAPEWQRARPA